MLIPTVRGLSPSKISTAVEKCPERLRLELVMREAGIPLPSGWSRVGGSAIHATLAFALSKLRSTRKLPSYEETADQFEPLWKAEEARLARQNQVIEEEEGDPKRAVFSESVDLIRPAHEYLRGMSQELQEPLRSIEEWARVRIRYQLGSEKGLVPVGGIIDLQTADYTIRDWKTTRFSVSGFARKKDCQMRAYGYWDWQQNRRRSTRIGKIFLVRGPRLSDLPEVQRTAKNGKPLKKLKKPEGWPEKLPLDWKGPYVQEEWFSIRDADRSIFERDAIQVWRMAQLGTYTTQTGTFWCSPKWCPFYAECQGG